jgi:polysaccharide pyruvyl transferase
MRIAVIAAPNPEYVNPGMLTVDLAAAAVLERAIPSSSISWYTLHPPDQDGPIHPYVDPSELPFRWLPLVERFDEVCAHDAIVLWGDFLQARHYFVEDALARLTNPRLRATSGRATLDLLYRCLLFSEAPTQVLNRIVIFGSTILFNQQSDYTLDRYGEHLRRLLRNCRGVWAREPLSAAKIQHLTEDYSAMPLGADAAFLLRDDDLSCLSTTAWLERPLADRVGLFFGARTRPPHRLVRFLTEATRGLEVQLEWLPWFPVHEWLHRAGRRWWAQPVRAGYTRYMERKIRRLLPGRGRYSAGDLLAAVARYRFVVTDTYHLCVNAWRAGTPALCFGDPDATPALQSLDDYKKRVLYEMYDARDFYFSTGALRGTAATRRAAERLRRIAGDRSSATAVSDRIRRHARDVEKAFAGRLGALVGSGDTTGATSH